MEIFILHKKDLFINKTLNNFSLDMAFLFYYFEQNKDKYFLYPPLVSGISMQIEAVFEQRYVQFGIL